MRPENYPKQDPISEFAQAYAEKITMLGSEVIGKDIPYGNNPYQSLGLHESKEPNGDIFLFLHGGGWTTGYKEWNNFMAPGFIENGVTFITVGYRLAPTHLFPSGVEDCINAIAWIYENISDYGGNPERIFLGGHSAGGHYASLLAVRNDWQNENNLPSNVISGCVPVSGVYRFGENSGLNQRPRFLGEKGHGAATAASPILNIQKSGAPFYMAYGDKDFPHLIAQALEMERALTGVGTSVHRVELENCDHLEAHLATADFNGVWFRDLLKFMSV